MTDSGRGRDEFDSADLQHAWRSVTPAVASHIDEDTWERLACDELTDFEKARTLEHVMSCAACADIYRGVATIRREAPAFDPGAPRPAAAATSAGSGVRVPWFRRPWALEAASAAAVAFVLIGYALFSAVRAPEDFSADVTRGAGGTAIAVLKPTVAAAFDRTFAWQRLDTVTTYRVVVFTATGDRVFELRDLKVPSVTVDESVQLPPGRYFWQVTGLRDGVQVSESPLTEFSVP